MMKKYGFTLIEIILSLALVGFLALLMVPALITNTTYANLKLEWKKAYSLIDSTNSLVLSQRGQGLVNAANASVTNATCANNNNCMKELFRPYLNVIKYCNSGSMGNCWHLNGNIKDYNGTTEPNIDTTAGGLVLSNGYLMIFASTDTNCASTPLANTCGWIYVDTNGFKGPNTVGRDIFGVWVLENSTQPFGITGDTKNGTCATSGWGCGYDYLAVS